MNKTLKLVLILSLVANAVWLLGSAAGFFSFGKPPDANARARSTAVADKTLSPEAAKTAVALLSTDDMAALHDRLREMGLPNNVVSAIVKGRIDSRYAARIREIDKAGLDALRQTPYWRAKFDPTGVMPTHYSGEYDKELSAINREKRTQFREILGDDGDTGLTRAIYPFLPDDKVARLSDIQSDYYDLRTQMIREMAGFRMPEDEAKLKMLDEEQHRDTQALLTPDEQMASNSRNSFIAAKLQQTFAGFDGTEEEYKAIFALQDAVVKKYDMTSTMSLYGGVNTQDQSSELSDALQGVETQIKDMLGDERYAEYQRAQRWDYQTLQAAAQRFDLAPETVSQAYQARDNAATEAQRISDDNDMDADQKTQAYIALAEQATAQIRAALGDNVGDAYINNALGWLKNLPKGGTVQTDNLGNVRLTPPKPAKK